MRKLMLLLALSMLSCAARISVQEFESRIREAGVWSGGPEERFETVGRDTLAAAIHHGLLPEDKVLDVGAGSLRVGWWLLQYIPPSNYYAIEPNREMVDTGARIIGADINVFYNSDFEFPDEEFDFVIARSIWTHASKPMIAKMLSEFAENSATGATFLTSVILARSADDDYIGEEWVGRSHEDNRSGVVRHSLAWIESECERNGLGVEVDEDLYEQTWLVIRKTDE